MFGIICRDITLFRESTTNRRLLLGSLSFGAFVEMNLILQLKTLNARPGGMNWIINYVK